jgi:hypothetical protein
MFAMLVDIDGLGRFCVPRALLPLTSRAAQPIATKTTTAHVNESAVMGSKNCFSVLCALTPASL